jgi:hypothetical protein
VNSVLQVNSTFPLDTVVPTGWIAAGRPAQLFSPDQHDGLWAVQEPPDFPGTMYEVRRGTSMREFMRRQSAPTVLLTSCAQIADSPRRCHRCSHSMEGR